MQCVNKLKPPTKWDPRLKRGPSAGPSEQSKSPKTTERREIDLRLSKNTSWTTKSRESFLSHTSKFCSLSYTSLVSLTCFISAKGKVYFLQYSPFNEIRHGPVKDKVVRWSYFGQWPPLWKMHCCFLDKRWYINWPKRTRQR